MTLTEEREREVVNSGLTYVAADDHSERPHWHTKYLGWKIQSHYQATEVQLRPHS